MNGNEQELDGPGDLLQESITPEIVSGSGTRAIVGAARKEGTRDAPGTITELELAIAVAYIENPRFSHERIALFVVETFGFPSCHHKTVAYALRKESVNLFIEQAIQKKMRLEAMNVQRNYLRAGDDEIYRVERNVPHRVIADVTKDVMSRTGSRGKVERLELQKPW